MALVRQLGPTKSARCRVLASNVAFWQLIFLPQIENGEFSSFVNWLLLSRDRVVRAGMRELEQTRTADLPTFL